MQVLLEGRNNLANGFSCGPLCLAGAIRRASPKQLRISAGQLRDGLCARVRAYAVWPRASARRSASELSKEGPRKGRVCMRALATAAVLYIFTVGCVDRGSAERPY